MEKYNNISALIVDDSKFILESLTALLHHIGIPSVETAINGADALLMVETNPEKYNLILCDLNMPGLDGVALLRWFALSKYQGGIIIISGVDKKIIQTAERVGRANQLNILGALEKPVQQEDVQSLLEHFLQTDFIPVAPQQRKKISEKDLRHAISHDEITLYYQPQIEISNGKVHGVESLVRWQHPQFGLISPGDFIPFAEKHGLINELTYSIIDKAFAQLRQWEGQFDGSLSINISCETLRVLDFPEMVCRAAEKHDISLTKVIFEVTESRLINDLASSLEVLSRLCLKGARLSIDDFGTGYSSLEQLKMIPFEELKIDRVFVHNSSGDKESEAILKSSIELAKSLGLKVVAEGIENQEDWNMAALFGCHYAQGYFLHRPMDAQKFLEWLGDWHFSRAKWVWRFHENSNVKEDENSLTKTGSEAS